MLRLITSHSHTAEKRVLHPAGVRTRYGAVVGILLFLIMLASLVPTPSQGASPRAEAVLPPSITKYALGTAFNNQSDCEVTDPLSEPVLYPADTTQIAVQVVFDVSQFQTFRVTVTGNFGGNLQGENCDKYIIYQGQVRQSQYGATIRRIDGAPFASDTYMLRVFINGSAQPSLEVPFTIPAQATDTPTATPTNTSTTAPTISATPTPSATATNTPIVAVTDTPTATPTATTTPTDTATPTLTATFTSTPTATPTATPGPLFVPMIITNPSPTPTPTFTPTETPTSTPTEAPSPTARYWNGTTNREYPTSFDISLDGSEWRNFTLKTDFSAPNCGATGTVEILVYGPGKVTKKQFSYKSGDYTFTGKFNSETSAAGTYRFDNYEIFIGLPFPPYVCYAYLTQSGTWTATRSTNSALFKVTHDANIVPSTDRAAQIQVTITPVSKTP